MNGNEPGAASTEAEAAAGSFGRFAVSADRAGPAVLHDKRGERVRLGTRVRAAANVLHVVAFPSTPPSRPEPDPS